MRRSTGILAIIAALSVTVGLIALQTTASADVRVRKAGLTGDKEVPGPGDPDGQGKAKLRINDEMGKVCFTLNYEEIAPPTAAHIHSGDSTVAGPVVVTLFSGQIPDTIHLVKGCAVLEPTEANTALLDDIQRNPRDYYVNVHNSEYPSGAIRGQLKKPR